MLELELYCCFFFSVCRAPNHAPMRFFFSRFVAYQIVLQCAFFFCGLSSRARNRAPAHQIVLHRVLFFTACRASDRAPMHQIVLQCVLFFFRGFVVHQIMLQCGFFFPGLSCTKSCCMVSIMLKVRALVIILFVL